MGNRPWTTFFGREQELARLRALVAEQPLVTLVGPAGVGKSRLAHELWPDALFVELTGTCDLDGVISAFCRALSIENSGTPLEAVRAALQAFAPGCVIVDGCDEARGAIASTIRAFVATNVRVLCTSRKALGVPGEQRWHVEPLASEDAERLFVDRARLVDPGFTVEPEDREDLDAVLAALGGFPLALELVAPRVRTLGLDGLRRRLPLGGGLEPLAEIVAASTASLPPATLDALLRLGVFPGSFDLASAEAVVADVDAHLEVLVAASLVASTRTARRRTFRLYEPVRARARRGLNEDPTARLRACTAHARHQLEAVTALLGADSIWSPATVRAIEDRIPDLRAADAALRDGHAALDRPAEARCLLVSALEPVIVYRGALPDLAAWVREAVALCRSDEDIAVALRANVLSLHALVLQRQGFVDDSSAHHLEAGAVALASGDRGALARAWVRWCVALVVFGRRAEALVVADALLREVDEPHLCTVVRMYRAMANLVTAKAIEEPVDELQRAVIDLRRRGDRRRAIIGQANLAVFLLYLGRLDQARAAFDELELDDDTDAHTRSSNLANRSQLLHELAFAVDPPDEATLAEADASYRTASAAFAGVGARPLAALVRGNYAMFLLERGDLAGAEREALESLADQPAGPTRAIAHAQLASLRALRGSFDEARALLHEARALLDDGSDVAAVHCLDLHEELVAHEERAHAGVRTRDDRTRARSKLDRYATFDVGPFSPRVRAAARVLSRRLNETPSTRPPSTEWQGSLVVGREESWLRAPCGTQIDLSQRPKLRALVAHLLRCHDGSRGRPVPAADLIAEVWPGERFVGQTARTRLHTLVFSLRARGLRDLVQSSPEGYCLAPELRVVRAEF